MKLLEQQLDLNHSMRHVGIVINERVEEQITSTAQRKAKKTQFVFLWL